MIHDVSIAGHPGREKTLAAARKKYYWPTLRLDVETCVKRWITCAQHKGTVRGPAPILQYLLPEAPWDIVSIDLLQLPESQYGSRYLLLCVDHLTDDMPLLICLYINRNDGQLVSVIRRQD